MMINPFVLFIALICLVGAQFARASNSDLRDFIRVQCQNKLKFDTIEEFRLFVHKFREYERRFVAAPAAAAAAKPKLGEILQVDLADQKDLVHERRCLNEKKAIYELDELIIGYNKKRPCKMNEILKLEEFARKHLMNKSKSIVLRFFTLFGVNIGIRCKLNILAHLEQADSEADQLDFIYSMASPTGWNVLINEYAKKTMKFGTSAQPASRLVNRIAKLVPGLSQVEHLEYLNFNHSLNDEANLARVMKENDGFERDSYQLEYGNKWHSKIHDTLNRIIESCLNLDQFYVNSLLSLARLKELGLLVEYLSDIHEHSVALHRWLAATSFCQLMVRVKILESIDQTTKGASIKLSVWHDDEKFSIEHRSKLYSYAAEFEDIDPVARDLAWCASVPEGRWRQKGEAMFVKSGHINDSVAMRRLKQFIKGLERTFERDDKHLSQ